MRFQSVLIANRGEIAVRVIRACRALGLRTIAVYSDADARALHVQLADAAVRIGPPPATESYLSIPTLLEAARESDADAVHPGYGFLAENAGFAEAMLNAGLVWIGPPPAAIRAMGDKSAAKRLMEAAGVPVVPGYQDEAQDDATLIVAAERIGYPLLVKASAGGGGRGMRVVREAAELQAAIEGARREALAAFGDDRLLLERYVSPARHVEVQIFGDEHGTLLHLGERECSIQRRHQKLIEESPSPAVTRALREALGQAAVQAARAVGYVNAGTVEFVLDAYGRYYFLEMNTRIQVEHPVTEFVTGLDLVQLQLRVAQGEPLAFEQADVRWHGHAIECRIVAEDPRKGFAPQTGTLALFEPPAGPGVRNDVGTYTGDRIGVYYDSLLAKLIVHGRDRQETLDRLARALDEYLVEGLATNLPLLRFVIEQPDFVEGRTYTDFIATHWQAEGEGAPLDLLLGAVAADLAASGAANGSGPCGPEPADIWDALGGWRIGRVGLPLRYRDGDREHRITATRDETAGDWVLDVDGEALRVTVEPLAPHAVYVRHGDVRRAFEYVVSSTEVTVGFDGTAHTFARLAPPSVERAAATGGGLAGHSRITSPLPGKVAKVLVEPGDAVQPRQTLVVLESMKIEHLIESPYAATVQAVHCQAGDVIADGALLIELEE